jgi:integrase
MASVYRKAGATGKTSPFWQARLKGIAGERIWLSTKQTNQKKALAISERWEQAVRLAEKQELNTVKAAQIQKTIEELTKTPETIELTRKLFNALLRDSIQEELKGQNFGRYCEEWLDHRTRRVASSSLAKYRSTVSAFVEFLGERRRSASVASITAGEIERFSRALLHSGKTASTVNGSIGILRALFNSARRQGVIQINPAEALEPIRSVKEDRDTFSDQQIKALLAIAGPEWRGAILLGFHAGLRLRDATELNWSNVDLEKRRLTFMPRKTSSRNGAATVLCLHRDIVTYLAEEAASDNDDPNAPLFPSLRGLGTGGTHGLSAQFAKLMDKAGIDVPLGKAKSDKGRRFRKLSFHALRHSFVSRLADAEVSPDVRKKFVGHSSDRVHDGYTHLDISLQAAAMEKLSSVL